MTTELRNFRDLVVALYQDGQRFLGENSPQIFRDKLASSIRWFSAENQLYAKMQDVTGDLGDRLVPLRPPGGFKNDPIIGMWCSWDFSEQETAWCKLELLMYRWQKGQVYGFRVDPPHDAPKHRFWHTQFTRAFTNAQTKFPDSAATWIHDSTPSYPIGLENPDRISPRDATVYALVSLYGTEIPRSILDKMRSVNYSPSLRYLVVETVAKKLV